MSEAARRFAAGVADQGAGDDLLIATHGMVMVAWLVSIGQVDAGRAAEEYWASLAFPDLVTLTASPAPPPGSASISRPSSTVSKSGGIPWTSVTGGASLER
jgi:broad specificity phosphatase PhoE